MGGIWLILIGRGDDARYSGDDDGFDDFVRDGKLFRLLRGYAYGRSLCQ